MRQKKVSSVIQEQGFESKVLMYLQRYSKQQHLQEPFFARLLGRSLTLTSAVEMAQIIW